jgi:hypothetical protein
LIPSGRGDFSLPWAGATQQCRFKGPPDGALFVANIDGSGIVQISPSISVTYKHDWSPDGQHLVVSDNSDPAPDEAVNIVTVRPDGSDWRYLTHYPAGFRGRSEPDPARDWQDYRSSEAEPQPSWEQVRHPPMRRSARDDLDVGQSEPRSTVATDDRKAMGGQQAPEIGRHSGMEMAQPWPG